MLPDQDEAVRPFLEDQMYLASAIACALADWAGFY